MEQTTLQPPRSLSEGRLELAGDARHGGAQGTGGQQGVGRPCQQSPTHPASGHGDLCSHVAPVIRGSRHVLDVDVDWPRMP
jgi:hypothetical protein